MTPETDTAAALVSCLCAWIDRLFPHADRGARLERALDERFGDDARRVTGEVCRENEAVAHEFSRHLALEHVADGSLLSLPGRRPVRLRSPRSSASARSRRAKRSLATSRAQDDRGSSSADAGRRRSRHSGVPQRPCACSALPEARVRDAITASNWEGTGVVRDIPCEPGEALDAAIGAMRRG